MKYTYCPIFWEVKAIRQCSLVSLIQYNMKTIFLEKSYTEYGEQTFQTLFWKIKIARTSGLLVWSFILFVFTVYQVEDYWNILKLLRYAADRLLLPHIKIFKKIKTRTSLELVSQPHFCIIFEEKYFSCCILLIDQLSLPGCPYFARYGAICLLQLFLTS